MNTPKIYVGTYAKYNNGSIKGAWLDLTDYNDKGSFLDACLEVHKDECDPELMFQDYKNFPKSFYHESSLDDRLFEYIQLDADEQEIVEAYLDNIESKADIQYILDSYIGTYTSVEDYVEETADLSDVPAHIVNYIDWKSLARDIELEGYHSFIKLSYDKTLVFTK